MTYPEASNAYDNDDPETHDQPEKCEDCGQIKCKCAHLEGWE